MDMSNLLKKKCEIRMSKKETMMVLFYGEEDETTKKKKKLTRNCYSTFIIDVILFS